MCLQTSNPLSTVGPCFSATMYKHSFSVVMMALVNAEYTFCTVMLGVMGELWTEVFLQGAPCNSQLLTKLLILQDQPSSLKVMISGQ